MKLNPAQGTPIGKNCHKIRISIASKGKGKSGGARIITNFIISEQTVYLLSIYDKSEKDNLIDNEITTLLYSIIILIITSEGLVLIPQIKPSNFSTL